MDPEKTNGSGGQSPGELRAAAASLLIERLQWARQHGLSFSGVRDLYEILGYDRVITPRQYREEYARGGLAGRVVDVFPKATWRGGVEITENDDPKNVTPFEKAVIELEKRIKMWSVLYKLDLLTGQGRYAVLLIGDKVQSDLSAELKKGRPENLVFLSPFSEEDAKIQSWEIDIKSERFGLPTSYLLSRLSADSLNWSSGTPAFSSPDFQKPVHWSRLIHVAEDTLDNEVYGAPTLERVWNYLQDLSKVCGGGSEAFWLRANAGLQLNLDKDMDISEPEKVNLREQAEEYQHSIRRMLRTRGVEINQLGSDVANFANPVEALVTLIAGAKAVPKRILVGNEEGSLASSQDRENFRDQVNGRQQMHVAPNIIRPVIDRFIKYGYLPSPSEGPDVYEVRWSHIGVLTEDEKATGAKSWAETATADGKPVFLAEEIRDKFYSLPPLTPEQLAAAMPPAAPVPGEPVPGEPVDTSPESIIDTLLEDDDFSDDDVDEDEELKAAGGKGSGVKGHETPGEWSTGKVKGTPEAAPAEHAPVPTDHKETKPAHEAKPEPQKKIEALKHALKKAGGSLTKSKGKAKATIPHKSKAAATKTAAAATAKLKSEGFTEVGKAKHVDTTKGKAADVEVRKRKEDDGNRTILQSKDRKATIEIGAAFEVKITIEPRLKIKAASDDDAWQLHPEGLVKLFEFEDRRKCASFVAALVNDANLANHHPDIQTVDDGVVVTYTTHAAGDTVTDLDYQAAERADRIALTHRSYISLAEAEEYVAERMAALAEESYSSTQVNIEGDLANELVDFAEQIPEEQLHEEGIEYQPHVTVKYGIHSKSPREIRELLAGAPAAELTLGTIDYFEGDDYDVVYVSVESSDLHELNDLIASEVECTDTHPEYTPHLTLAYVKSGEGENYQGDTTFVGRTIVADHISFITVDDEETVIALTPEPKAAESVQDDPDSELIRILEVAIVAGNQDVIDRIIGIDRKPEPKSLGGLNSGRYPRGSSNNVPGGGSGKERVGSIAVYGTHASREVGKQSIAALPEAARQELSVKELHITATEKEAHDKTVEYMEKHYGVGAKIDGDTVGMVDRKRGIVIAHADHKAVTAQIARTFEERIKEIASVEESIKIPGKVFAKQKHVGSDLFFSDAVLSIAGLTNPITAVLENGPVHDMMQRWGWIPSHKTLEMLRQLMTYQIQSANLLRQLEGN